MYKRIKNDKTELTELTELTFYKNIKISISNINLDCCNYIFYLNRCLWITRDLEVRYQCSGFMRFLLQYANMNCYISRDHYFLWREVSQRDLQGAASVAASLRHLAGSNKNERGNSFVVETRRERARARWIPDGNAILVTIKKDGTL